MFIAALFTVPKTWKPPKCPSTYEWIKKIWCIYIKNMYIVYMYIIYIYTHAMEYYSAICKGEIIPFAATWMDLESIILIA